MARKGSGVSIYGTGIRIRMTVNGQSVNEVVRISGKVAPPTKGNVRHAHILADEIRRHLLNGTYRHSDYFASGDTGREPTVGDYLDTWHKTLSGATESTRVTARRVIDSAWKPAFGDKPLGRLVKSDILAAFSDMPVSGKTKNNRLSILRQALQLAVDDGVLSANPAESIEAFSHQKPPPDPFTAEERERILAYFEKHAPEPILNYFAFQFWTGLRTSEGLGLCWSQIDGRRLYVTRGLVMGEMTEHTKTHAARVVDLNDFALAALKRQAKYTRLAGGRVFHDPHDDRPWDDDQRPRKIFARALNALSIRYRSPYHTRHTYATTMIMAGLRPAYVAGQMGHSVQILFARYARWLDGADNDDEQRKLSAYVNSAMELPRSPNHNASNDT